MLKPNVMKVLVETFHTLQKEITAGTAKVVNNHHERNVKIDDKWYTVGTQDTAGHSAMATRVRTGVTEQINAGWFWTHVSIPLKEGKHYTKRIYLAKIENDKIADLNAEIPVVKEPTTVTKEGTNANNS